MTRFWLRWTLRDFRARWIQIVATALVLAVGVGGFAGLRSLKPWRDQSARESLAALHAHDLRVDLIDGAVVSERRLQGALEQIPPGLVGAAEERLVASSQIDASRAGKTVLVPARLIGIPGAPGTQAVDAIALKSSSRRTAGERQAAVLDWSFARHYDLASRGHVRIAGLGSVPYAGLGVSPQYFLIVGDAGTAGAESGLAIVYLPLGEVQHAAGKPRAVNELLVRAAPGADLPRVERAVRRALAASVPEAGFTVTRGSEEPVSRIIFRDARNDQKTYTLFAILLLAGAALAAFNLVSRVVEAQRREIGIGMALGVEPRALAIRPLAIGLQIGLLGALLGVPVGIGLAELIKSLLRGALPLPVSASTFPLELFAEGAALALAIPLLAAALPVRRAIGVRPIEAIMTGYRAAKGAGAAPLLRRIRPPGSALVQLPLRNLMRTPRRTLMTVLALGAVMTAVVAVLGMIDSIDDAAGREQRDALTSTPDRLIVTLSELVPDNGATMRRIAAAHGVRSVEPGLTVGASVRAGAHVLPVALTLVDTRSRVWRPRAIEGTIAGPGIVLAEKAARDLGVAVGDTVTLRHPRYDGTGMGLTGSRVRVIGIHANPIRAYAYMDNAQAPVRGLGGLANRVTIVPDAHTPSAALQRALLGLPGVASVQPAAAEADALQAAVDAFSGAIQMVVAITLGLGLLVAFTSASVSIDERRREYATMFAIGLPPRAGLRVAMVESLTTGLLGTLVGLAAGFAVTAWTVERLLSTTFPDLGIHATLTAASVLTTLVTGIGAVTLAPLLTFRRMRRMDIPSTLRVME
jgi:putative ABC transport system permease protein